MTIRRPHANTKKCCNKLLIVMIILFGPTKSDLTMLIKIYDASGGGGCGIRILVVLVMEQQCLSHVRR